MQKLTKEQIQQKIETEEDFIDSPRFGYSIEKIIDRYPDGVDYGTISKVLHLTPEEVEKTFLTALKKVQEKMKLEIA